MGSRITVHASRTVGSCEAAAAEEAKQDGACKTGSSMSELPEEGAGQYKLSGASHPDELGRSLLRYLSSSVPATVTHRTLTTYHGMPRIAPNDCCVVTRTTVLVEAHLDKSHLHVVTESSGSYTVHTENGYHKGVCSSKGVDQMHVYCSTACNTLHEYSVDANHRLVPVGELTFSQGNPWGIDISADGVLVGAEPYANAVSVYETIDKTKPEILVSKRFGPDEVGEENISMPRFIAWSYDGKSVFVTNRGKANIPPNVIRVDVSGAPRVVWRQVVVDPWNIRLECGKLYVTHKVKKAVTVLNPSCGRTERIIICPGVARGIYTKEHGEITIVSYANKQETDTESRSNRFTERLLHRQGALFVPPRLDSNDEEIRF